MEKETDFYGNKKRRSELIQVLTGKVANGDETLECLSTNQLERCYKKLQRIIREVAYAAEHQKATGEYWDYLNPNIQDVDLSEDFWRLTADMCISMVIN